MQWNCHFYFWTKGKSLLSFYFPLLCDLHFLWLLVLWFLCISIWSPWKSSTRCSVPSLYSSISHCEMFVLTHQNGHLHRYMLLYNEVKPILCYSHFFLPIPEIAKIKPKIFLLQNRKIDSCSELITPPPGSKAKLKCMCAHKHTKFSKPLVG